MIGKFVADERYGPAKVVGFIEGKHTIEYFISPWNRKQSTVSLGTAKPLRLLEQTRVYVETRGQWRMGRVILAHEKSGNEYDYDVQFPNKVVQRISEEELYCRCWLEHDDPTTTLALGGMETQYWHEHRQRFAATLQAQRGACRGLKTILSSCIELVPHQIEVARRVLEDPLQRYLLADEVGMGKTIEAGLVIRQFLLSHSKGNVLVVVPDSLTKQWSQELQKKFLVGEFPDRVHVCSLGEIENILVNTISLLVVDEAHHLVADDIPEALQQLARTSPRILLLSATPSLGNADVLLRLLKLLDPDCYSSIGSDEFSAQIEKREEFGIFLRGLRVDANPAVIRQRLRRVSALFSKDSEVLRLSDHVSNALAEDDKDALRLGIHSLRGYVADVYRIHQRLIRTRRRDAADWVFRPRGPMISVEGVSDQSHVFMTWVSDSRHESVFDIFEQWRIQMASRFPAESTFRKELASWVVMLFEAISCGIDYLSDALDKVPIQFLDIDWREAFNAALIQPNNESPRSEQIAVDLKRHLTLLMHRHANRTPRIVVFGSEIQDLKACATALANLIGNDKVLLSSELQDDKQDIASRFESANLANVLFCSRNEEEGLNLHFVDAIVHLDLPFSPSRVEQRIGRLDRYGRKLDRIEQRIVFPELDENSSLWEAWYDILAKAFHIFNEPVADVQFSLEAITSELADNLLEQGSSGLRSVNEKVRLLLAQERERLDNQYALDQVLQEESTTSGLFQDLEDLESDESEIADATKGWLIDSLQLMCKGDFNRIFRFIWDRDRTLLPVWPWAAILQPGLASSHTFFRRYASHATNGNCPQLLRIGSTLLRSIEREYNWDDRGTAFATWRHVLEPGQQEWLAFKLCYTIDARLPDELSNDEKNALRTRLDGYLPPWSDVIYIDADLNPVIDSIRLDCLSQPYKGHDTNGCDYNLGSRQEVLFSLIDATQFERLCFSIRSSSEAWLRDQANFKQKLSESYERGVLDIERRNRRLNQKRHARAIDGEMEDTNLTREIELNQKILETLGNPVVKLDAIGVIVLSGRTPQEFIGEVA